MSDTFQYSVLKYRHSFLLNEVVNVGLLLCFPSERIIKFIYPSRLHRISGLYTDFDIGIIRTAQGIFEGKCRDLNSNWTTSNESLFGQSEAVNFDEVITTHFLVEDATALYFDTPKKGVNIGVDRILSHYYEEYFSCYKELVNHVQKRDEKFIEQTIKAKLREKLRDAGTKINLEINKEISLGLISEKFRLGWQNGTQNLITPISFDVVESETIKQKSLYWFGKLSFLGKHAEQNNISFHIVTSKPTDRSLFKAYENALKIVEQADAPKQLYEEVNIEEYANYIASSIHY